MVAHHTLKRKILINLISLSLPREFNTLLDGFSALNPMKEPLCALTATEGNAAIVSQLVHVIDDKLVRKTLSGTSVSIGAPCKHSFPSHKLKQDSLASVSIDSATAQAQE
jgi:hypothetical protein